MSCSFNLVLVGRFTAEVMLGNLMLHEKLDLVQDMEIRTSKREGSY